MGDSSQIRSPFKLDPTEARHDKAIATQVHSGPIGWTACWTASGPAGPLLDLLDPAGPLAAPPLMGLKMVIKAQTLRTEAELASLINSHAILPTDPSFMKVHMTLHQSPTFASNGVLDCPGIFIALNDVIVGSTLDGWMLDVLSDAALSPLQQCHKVADVAGKLMRVVVKLEEHKVAHRDIKPQNLIVTQVASTAVVVIDTDSMKLLDEEGKLEGSSVSGSPRCGTVNYEAPEIQAAGGLKYDGIKSESYSAVVTIIVPLMLHVRALDKLWKVLKVDEYTLDSVKHVLNSSIDHPKSYQLLIDALLPSISYNPDHRPNARDALSAIMDMRDAYAVMLIDGASS